MYSHHCTSNGYFWDQIKTQAWEEMAERTKDGTRMAEARITTKPALEWTMCCKLKRENCKNLIFRNEDSNESVQRYLLSGLQLKAFQAWFYNDHHFNKFLDINNKVTYSLWRIKIVCVIREKLKC